MQIEYMHGSQQIRKIANLLKEQHDLLLKFSEPMYAQLSLAATDEGLGALLKDISIAVSLLRKGRDASVDAAGQVLRVSKLVIEIERYAQDLRWMRSRIDTVRGWTDMEAQAKHCKNLASRLFDYHIVLLGLAHELETPR